MEMQDYGSIILFPPTIILKPVVEPGFQFMAADIGFRLAEGGCRFHIGRADIVVFYLGGETTGKGLLDTGTCQITGFPTVASTQIIALVEFG